MEKNAPTKKKDGRLSSKAAIFPETREGNVHISNESARGWSLRKANV